MLHNLRFRTSYGGVSWEYSEENWQQYDEVRRNETFVNFWSGCKTIACFVLFSNSTGPIREVFTQAGLFTRGMKMESGKICLIDFCFDVDASVFIRDCV